MGTLQITKEAAKIIPGPLKICMERGYVVLIDELNLASETIFSFLESLMTNPQTMIDPISGDVIRIHPEFAMICTQNPPTYEGREPLPIGIRNNAILMTVPTYSL
jgi:midasin (ATPase involved in ribosome maturation)